MILKNLNFCNRQMIADKINAIISNVIYELFYVIIGRVTKTPMLLVHPMTEVIFFSICSSYHPFLFVCVFGEHVQCPCRCNKANFSLLPFDTSNNWTTTGCKNRYTVIYLRIPGYNVFVSFVISSYVAGLVSTDTCWLLK